MAIAIGTRLGAYEIVSAIGAGGMGEVYRARDARLARDVAIKILPEAFAKDSTRLRRFNEEARAAGQLNHPNILSVYDVGTHTTGSGHTTPYIVSELLEGETLRSRLEQGAIPVRKAIEYGRQTAEGLAAAHDRGVVHRDLKPENLFVTSDGRIKILDFGLAKLTRPGDDVSRQPGSVHKTDTLPGTVLGTVGYMSPEQVRGEAADHRSDLFTVGVILYEMLTGRSPFTRATAVETMGAILKGEPDSPLTNVPVVLERIVLRCLETDLSARFQSARDLAFDLESVRITTSGEDRRPSAWAGTRDRPGLRRWAPIVAGALSLAALAGYVVFSREPTPQVVGRSGRPGVAVLQFENHSGSPEVAWLSKGLPSMILTGLAQTPGLDVISPRRIEQESELAGLGEAGRADKAQLSEMARRAGAGALVTGSIFTFGPETRIDVQVEEIATGRIIAADSARGTDVFALIDGLTGRIRDVLRLRAEPGDRSIASIAALTSRSLDAYRLYIEGVEAMDNFRLAQARQSLEKATEVDPTFAIAYSTLAEVAIQTGDNVSSVKYEAKALEHLNRLPEREQLLVRGRVARREGRLDEAERLLKRLVSQYPDAEAGYHYLAHVYDDRSELSNGVDLCKRAVQMVPAAVVIRNECGYVFLNGGRYPDAIEQFREYVRLRPREANSHDSLAEAYLITGDPERAIAGFTRALEIDPAFFNSLRGRAFAYGILGQYDPAIRDSQQSTEVLMKAGLPPAIGRFFTAVVLSRVGRYRDAQQAIERGRSEAEAVNDTIMRANLALLAAWLSLERGDHSEAIAHTETAGRLTPHLRDPELRRVRILVPVLAGVAHARAGSVDRAQKRLDGVRNVFDRTVAPENSWVRSLEGEITLARGDTAAADLAFATAEPPRKSFFGLSAPHYALFSNQLPFRDGRARARALAGDLTGSVTRYRELLTPGLEQKWTTMLEPRFVLQLARLLEKSGDAEGARAEYRRFAELWKDADADLPELREARQKVASLFR